MHLAVLCILLFVAGSAAADTLNVPGTYATIQGAINAALNGDTIEIAAGTYVESLNITGKGLTLRGVDEATVIIDAGDFHQVHKMSLVK